VIPAFDPADPLMGIRNVHDHPVVSYTHREATDPENWRRLNENLSPANGAGQ
jgi:hypothetical protein